MSQPTKMALESNHNFRLDQMVWAQFSDNGGFWPAIISRDKRESQKRWCIENNIHVQFISPPYVRACGQVIKVLKFLSNFTERKTISEGYAFNPHSTISPNLCFYE